MAWSIDCHELGGGGGGLAGSKGAPAWLQIVTTPLCSLVVQPYNNIAAPVAPARNVSMLGCVMQNLVSMTAALPA